MKRAVRFCGMTTGDAHKRSGDGRGGESAHALTGLRIRDGKPQTVLVLC